MLQQLPPFQWQTAHLPGILAQLPPPYEPRDLADWPVGLAINDAYPLEKQYQRLTSFVGMC